MKLLSYPLSLFYRVGLTLDRFFKSQNKVTLSRPVISVGNITMGGTGKTPFMIKLAQDLRSLSLRPAILTRGYRGFGRSSSNQTILFGPGSSDVSSVSDEARLMAEKLSGVPIGVGSNRVLMAQQILEKHNPDIFILDDGFQHWKLNRQLDLVCLDASNPWGNGALLPFGPLRESLNSLSRADAIILTRCDLVSEKKLSELKESIRKYFPAGPLFSSFFKSVIPEFSGKKVLAVSAIGNPDAFEESLKRQGLEVFSKRFLDHHEYSAGEAALIEAESKRLDAVILTTEKDAVKLKQFSLSMVVSRLEFVFLGNDEAKWKNLLSQFVRTPRAEKI